MKDEVGSEVPCFFLFFCFFWTRGGLEGWRWRMEGSLEVEGGRVPGCGGVKGSGFWTSGAGINTGGLLVNK